MSALAILGGTPLSDPLSVQNNFLSMKIKSKQHKQTAFQKELDFVLRKIENIMYHGIIITSFQLHVFGQGNRQSMQSQELV